MTWMLWNALRYPQWKHPIFRHALAAKTVSMPLAWYWRLLLFVFGLAFAGFAAFFPILAVISLFGMALAIPVLILVFNGTALGLYWVGAISDRIAAESRTKRIDLLSLLPEGAFGANWRMALGIIHRDDWLNKVYRVLKWTVSVVLIILAWASLMLLWGAFSASMVQERESQMRVLREVLMIGIVLLFFWADHIQSIVLALLTALLLPHFQHDEALLKLFAPLIFLLLQCLNYLFAFSLYILAMDIGKDAVLISCLIALIIFCFFRELLIRVLWRFLLNLSFAAEEAQIVRA